MGLKTWGLGPKRPIVINTRLPSRPVPSLPFLSRTGYVRHGGGGGHDEALRPDPHSSLSEVAVLLQIRPGYGKAGPAREPEIKDFLAAIQRLESRQNSSDPGRSSHDKEVDKRLAKIEAKIFFGGVVLSGVLGVAIMQPSMIYKVQLDQDAMSARIDTLEAKPSPSPAPPAISPAAAPLPLSQLPADSC